jgi:hypothetical protein
VRGFRAPKYSCTVCGKTFRRQKQHFNHVMGKCKARGTNKKAVEQSTEARTLEPQRYYGREYTNNPIPTGNRHLRTGIPLPRISNHERAAI